jgi:diadenylate cyclase
LSNYNVTLTMENIRTITVMFLDILVMWLVLYYAIQLIRKSRKTVQIFKGILVVLLVDGIARFLGMKTVEYFADIFVNWGFLAIIIIFQEELRSLLEGLGKSNVLSRINTLTGNEKENLVDQIVTATMLLSQDQTGALICIEQNHSLDDFIATGTPLNSDVSAELLTSIFVTSTPLHDGAVIIQGNKIACASAYFPPTNQELPNRYGARHRAAIGISEITDAVTIVVSEETGAVSIAEGGSIHSVNRRQLRDHLLRMICGAETEVHTDRRKGSGGPAAPGRDVLIDEKPASSASKARAAAESTAALNQLAEKKEKEEEGETSKIQAEAVVVTGQEEDPAMKHLDQEASEIKLPRKKKRPKPSYPENEQVRRFAEERRRQAARENAEAKMPPVPKPKKTQAEAAEQKEAETDNRAAGSTLAASSLEKPVETKAAAFEQPSAQVPQDADKTPAASDKPASSTQKFDAAEMDLTRLMGMDEELDKTMTIIGLKGKGSSPEGKASDSEKKGGGGNE